MATRHLAGDVEAGGVRVDGQLDLDQLGERDKALAHLDLAFKIDPGSIPVLRDLGLSGVALAAAPTVKTHDLDIPRIGYVHSWTRTQDEGWVRMALDKLKVPYTYFGDNLVRQGNLRAKYAKAGCKELIETLHGVGYKLGSCR